MTQRLILCAGLQSSGSTLVSWCFLQRSDMDGVLDAHNDELFVLPPRSVSTPHAWIKFTISCFRFEEVTSFYRDLGFEDVGCLLVVRDPRHVLASLRTKLYGLDGTTAEDPPLRMRLRRFRRDWEQFRAKGWPVLRYEALVAEPEATLRAACTELDLPWDEAMLTWPKPIERIRFPINGNRTLHATRDGGLANALRGWRVRSDVESCSLPEPDLRWVEAEFADLLAAEGYPPRLEADAGASAPPLPPPSFAVTRRHGRNRELRELRARAAFWDRVERLAPVRMARWARRTLRGRARLGDE